MNYPLQLRFKILSLTSKVVVLDANENTVCFVKQKMFKLRENIEVFADDQNSRQIATISADKILDWSARYTFTDTENHEIGSVGRQGLRSIWRARYDVFPTASTEPSFNVQEENPWAKVADSVIGGIPIIGALTGYLFQPTYLATGTDGTPAMRVRKQPAFFEGKFTIEKLTELTTGEEINLIYSFLMLLLLERQRG